MKNNETMYRMPAEWEEHEGTWLQWPQDGTHKGDGYKEKLEPIWIQMTKELHTAEKVHIVVRNEEEWEDVSRKLSENGVELSQIDFLLCETDDIWIRDNGPMFVKDEAGQQFATDWNFNGWGGRYPCEKDCQIAAEISRERNIPHVDAGICLEGGGVEVDGKGSFMAAKSSIINDNRNPGKSQKEIEAELTKYLGVTNFVWITGIRGEDNADEVTDFHIDGAARFSNEHTILYDYDLFGESEQYVLDANDKHYEELRAARDIDGNAFQLIPVTRTRKNVETAGHRGSYLNYYVGNEVVLVPIYGDENDEMGLKIVEGQYPGRRVVGINVCSLYEYGGMIHCVTQQQPKK